MVHITILPYEYHGETKEISLEEGNLLIVCEWIWLRESSDWVPAEFAEYELEVSNVQVTQFREDALEINKEEEVKVILFTPQPQSELESKDEPEPMQDPSNWWG